MIATESYDDVLVLRFEHGAVNVLDTELCLALCDTLAEHADAAVVLTGAGRAFSAGVDLKRLAAGGAAYVEEFLPALSAAFLAVFDHPRPVVAAINGHAIAGGCVIAAACDVRLMSGGGIGLTELAVGVPFPVSAIEIVRYAAGPAAARLVLEGPVLSPAEAQACGLVGETVAPADLLGRAVETARRLAQVPAPVYAFTKQQLHRPARKRIDTYRKTDDATVLDAWRSPAATDTITAYLSTLHK